MAIKIGLDAGHGLRTSGKQTPDGIKEWTLNDKVRDKVVAMLKDYDVEIIHTDNDEGYTDESLASRLNRYINAGVKVYVSIHHNAFTGTWNSATGVGVFMDRNYTAQDKKLAQCIQTRLVKYTGLRDRGIQKENFYVINQNRIPAVLVEGGFMDSTIDYKVITSDAGQTAYAKAVAEGLIEFLGLTKKVSTPPSPTPSTSKVSSAVKTLVEKGVIESPDYWEKKQHDLKYLDILLGSIAKFAKPNKIGGLKNVKDAINHLGKCGVMTDTNYWLTNYSKVKYLDILLISAANHILPVVTKTLDAWAKEVIDGKHGTGHTNREASLKKAGCPYAYEDVKAKVNELCGVKTNTVTKVTKSLDAWAREVIAGKHGTGHINRAASLKKAGCTYLYDQVKARVNALLK